MLYRIQIRRILQPGGTSDFSVRLFLTLTYQSLDAWLGAYRIYSVSIFAPTSTARACLGLLFVDLPSWLHTCFVSHRHQDHLLLSSPLGLWSNFSADVTFKIYAGKSNMFFFSFQATGNIKIRRTGASSVAGGCDWSSRC